MLDNELAHLDLGLAERLHHELMVCAQEGGDLLGLGGGIRLTLLLATLLLEFLQQIIRYLSTVDLPSVLTSSPRFMTADVPL